MDYFISILSAFFGCFAIGFVFRFYKNYDLAIIASFIGAIGWSVYLSTSFYHNAFLQSFLAMCVVSFLSEICARLFKAPVIVFIMIGFFPLVPGKGIYNTMLYAVQGQSSLFITSLLDTLGISFALALGILLISTLFRVYKRIIEKDYISIDEI